MVHSAALIVFACLLATSAGMRETCTQQGVRYADRASFESVKQDGSHYSCTCYNTGCRRITCTKRSGPTQTRSRPGPSSEDEDDEGITGEVPGSENGVRPVVTPNNPRRVPVFLPNFGDDTSTIKAIGGTGSCFDEESQRTFQRGNSFIRITRDGIRKSCSCPSVGAATIRCEVAGCKLPDPPSRTPSFSYIDGCFDAWNNREYRSGERYNRTRYMDVSRQITGVYSCSCIRNMMRCSAVDIPCCDLATGEFVPAGERFVTLHRGYAKMTCTCEGKRGRYSRCLRDGENPFGPGGRLVPRPSRPRYQRIGGGCKDNLTRRTYQPNERWLQDRGSRGTWRCKCKLIGSVFRTNCQYFSA